MCSLQQHWRKGQNRFFLEARESGEEGGDRGAARRNDPNNVCTCEYMNKEEKKKVYLAAGCINRLGRS
jgi:hypothetical protein